MNSSIVSRAKAGRRFGLAMMLAGLVPVLLFLAQSLLRNARPGLLIAVVGLAVMMIGASIVRRQRVVPDVAERIEPYIGPGLPGGAQVTRDQ